MHRFNFIASSEFRDLLESDYTEIEKCLNNSCWKAAHVLAGSILETLLIDFLLATNDPPRGNKDLLKIDLFEAIKICLDEDILSERTANLSSVLRSYRNLIHPGKIVRLKETKPDEDSAKIAFSLINMIIAELAFKTKSKFGLTAEQIISKIEADENCLAILPHLISELSHLYKEILLIELLPQEFFELEQANKYDFNYQHHYVSHQFRIGKAFRMIFESSSEELKRKVSERYVTILREDNSNYINTYTYNFFLASDLEYITRQNDVALIKSALLSRVGQIVNCNFLRRLNGIHKFLTKSELETLIDAIVRALIQPNIDEVESRLLYDFVKNLATTSTGNAEKDDNIDKWTLERFNKWIESYHKQGLTTNASTISEAKEYYEGLCLPF